MANERDLGSSSARIAPSMYRSVVGPSNTINLGSRRHLAIQSGMEHLKGLGPSPEELATLRADPLAQSTLVIATSVDYRSSLVPNALPNDRPSRAAMWEYAQDYAPIVVWPPGGPGDEVEFDPEGSMPIVRQSITTLRIPSDLLYQEVHQFFSMFLPRYIYDYGRFDDTFMLQMRRRFEASSTLKHAMLGTAVLFRSNYERSELTPTLRSHAKELHLLAMDALQSELENKRIPPGIKLAGLMELSSQEYFAGNFVAYYHYLSQGASIVRSATGNQPIDLLKLSGAAMFDVLWFAWCDIMSSMALSRPTLLSYESDVPSTPPMGATRPTYLDPNNGIEAIFSCPDVLAVFLARITSLRHARFETREKLTRGGEIEHLVRHWQFRPMGGKQSTLRIARLGTQEIWRHTTILYIHQAIFRSNSSNSVVKDSVKTIIRIASTLTSGVNPDCFLPVPYFIAGYFAVSERDRNILRGRVLGCGNERLQRDLAAALEGLWRETDTKGGPASWSKASQPPSFIF